MKKSLFNIFLTLAIFFSIHSITNGQKYEILGYFHGSRSPKLLLDKSRNSESFGKINYLSIINYAFAIPRPDSNKNIIPFLSNPKAAYQQIYDEGMSIDGIADNPMQKLKGQFNQFRKLKELNPRLKILISIGGWGGSKYFSDAALTEESREIFVDACIDKFIRGNLPEKNNSGGVGAGTGIFDGIDLDWEFPLGGGPEGSHVNPNDRENHTELFKLFRSKLDEIDPDLLLTAAVSGRSNEFYKYNFNEDQKYLNWINIMSYDLHGLGDEYTGHHTNLFSSKFDVDPKQESLDKAVRYLIDSAGVAPSKIFPGAAFYGKGWKEVPDINNGLFQKGEFIKRWGLIRIDDYKNLEIPGFEYYWDENSLAPYLYSKEEEIFWTFDDIRSIALKTRYVEAFNLGGLMFWQIFGDDSNKTLMRTIQNNNMPDVQFLENDGDKTPPEISILYPQNNTSFKPGENIPIKTVWNDEQSTVIKVDYLVDGISIGYNTIEPFNWIWFNAKRGDHYIQCIAYDEYGNSKKSNRVKITIAD